MPTLSNPEALESDATHHPATDGAVAAAGAVMAAGAVTATAVIAGIAALADEEPWDARLSAEMQGPGFDAFWWADLCATLVRQHPALAVAGRELECKRDIGEVARLCAAILHGVSIGADNPGARGG